jgi:hypothetical protein
MPSSSPLLSRLGFEVWQVPGVSRAWRREFEDGSFILVTDLGGFDLPESGGPYCPMFLSRRFQLLNCAREPVAAKGLFEFFDQACRRAMRGLPLHENSPERP